MRLASLLLALLATSAAPLTEAKASAGRFVFSAQERGGVASRTKTAEYDDVSVEWHGAEKGLAVFYEFPQYVSGRSDGISTYFIDVGPSGTSESLTHQGGARKSGKEAAERLKSVYNDDQVLTTHLWAFEAMQRLVSPEGLLFQSLQSVFSSKTKCRKTQYTSPKGNKTVPAWSCGFNVPNDSEKRYTDKQLDKLFTRWQTVISEQQKNSALQTEHVVKYREPIGQLRIRVAEEAQEVYSIELMDKSGKLVMAFERTVF